MPAWPDESVCLLGLMKVHACLMKVHARLMKVHTRLMKVHARLMKQLIYLMCPHAVQVSDKIALEIQLPFLAYIKKKLTAVSVTS